MIIWPNQNNPEPPDEPEHYPECPAHDGGFCICDDIAQQHADDATSRQLAERKEDNQ